MPRTKKKKPIESIRESKKLSHLFFITIIVLIFVLWLLKDFFNIPVHLLLVSWLVFTAIALLILWIVDKRAASAALDMLGRP